MFLRTGTLYSFLMTAHVQNPVLSEAKSDSVEQFRTAGSTSPVPTGSEEPFRTAGLRFYTTNVEPRQSVQVVINEKKDFGKSEAFFCGDRRSRTDDPLLAKQML